MRLQVGIGVLQKGCASSVPIIVLTVTLDSQVQSGVESSKGHGKIGHEALSFKRGKGKGELYINIYGHGYNDLL